MLLLFLKAKEAKETSLWFSLGDMRGSTKTAESTNKYTQVENVAIKQTFTDEEIESIKKYMQSNPESIIKDYLKNTPPEYTSSFDDIRRVLGGQSELAGDMHQAGHFNKATLDFLLEDVMTVVSKDSSLSERALAGFFLINKPGKIVDRVYDGVGTKGNGEIDNYFIGTLKGEKVHLPGVKVEEIIYTKRLPEETAKLRKEFNSSIRKNFLKEFANNSVRAKYLSEAGLGVDDIARMKDGLNPKGWQVHHNLPLDDGGTNEFTNLVLIKNDPYHKAVTNEQNSLTRGLSPKQSKTINWPMFEDNVYPTKPFKRRDE
ncbi:HNH endonuclease signature motif containing protein [Metabacillus litoralis]|uniref:HNH endonuclease signature motif containing protein n=1 Tax=Metabacillus litoralis TaxID=152268 RepID=UPI001878F54C|nr:HNH endonuclease signature motif containing protein [Metabacillus litoralis]